MSAKRNILIAEDSSVILSLTKKILELQQYNIQTAKNGREVMKQVDSNSFDAILLDINIPVIDGMECARQIRKNPNPEVANTPIIAITGNANNYSMEDFQQAGINAYLPKPLDFDQLVTVVKQYTQK